MCDIQPPSLIINHRVTVVQGSLLASWVGGAVTRTLGFDKSYTYLTDRRVPTGNYLVVVSDSK